MGMSIGGGADRAGDTLRPGTEIAGYRIESTIRRDAFANYYRARLRHEETPVLIRELYPSFVYRAPDGEVCCFEPSLVETLRLARRRFIQEGRALGAIQSPALPHLFTVEEANSSAYWVLEPSAGTRLGDLINGGTADAEDIFRVALTMHDALEPMHSAGVLHLDVEPNNVLVHGDTMQLVGHAFARFAMLRFNRDITRRVPHKYAPLELHAVNEPADPASDIYGAAAILYHLAIGSPPPDAPARTRNDPVADRLGRASDRIGCGIAGAIEEGLGLLAEDRPQSIAEWRRSFLGAA